MSRIRVPLTFLAALALALAPVAVGAAAAEPTAPTAYSDGTGDQVTWSVEPAPVSTGLRRTFEYAVDPGTQIVDNVLVTNSGENSADFTLYATDAINDPDTGAFGLLKHDTKPTDVGAWVTLDRAKLTLEPGQQATIPFNLLVPSDASPGDHVAGIVASVLTTGTENGAAVTLEQRVGARLYLNVSGGAKAAVAAQGVVTGFNPSWNPFAPGDLSIGYDVRNTGNLRVDVAQKITVAGPFGIPLGSVSPRVVTNILPRQLVHVTAKVPAVVALFLAWSTITLVPSEPSAQGDGTSTSSGSTSPTPTPTPTPSSATPNSSVTDAVEVGEAADYVPASSTVMTLAVSWTLLVVILLIAGIIYLVWRYVTGTRERLYLAIDEAAAAAREEALQGASADRP
jgi:hypothetical protein